jgi:tetratricopeptide (TPR) repeat protein
VLAHRRTSSLCLATAALVLALALVAVPQLAEAQDGGDPPGYREAILEAVAEYEAQNYLEARSLFLKAHDILPNARTYRGLGVVSFELRRYSETIAFLESALASDQKRLDGTMRSEAERLLARAWTFVAQLEITLDPGDTRVAIDGAEAAPLADRLLLDVATHQLEFQAPGHRPVHRSFAVAGGERRAWNIALPRAASKVPATAGERSAPSRHRLGTATGTVAIGLGVASFVLAGVYLDQRRDKGAALREVPESTFNPDRLSAWERSRSKPYLFAAVGAVATTAAVLGLLLSAPRERTPWWVSMLAGLGGAGLVFWGAAEVVHGAPCDLPPRLQGRCTLPLEQRDRGAIVLLLAAPLLAVPLTQLVRWAFVPSRSNSNFAFNIHTSALQRTVVVDASVHWL